MYYRKSLPPLCDSREGEKKEVSTCNHDEMKDYPVSKKEK